MGERFGGGQRDSHQQHDGDGAGGSRLAREADIGRRAHPRQDATLRTRILFVTVHERMVGLLVDSAKEFLNLPADSIRPIEETLTGINGKYLKAVTKAGARRGRA